MSLSGEVTRIKTAAADIAQAIRNKGVTVPTTAKISDLAPLVSSIPVSEAPKLQSTKVVYPSFETQNVTPDAPYVGLRKVEVRPIPEQYVDTTSGDATSYDILNGKKAWVDGKEVTGNILTYDGSFLQTRYDRETDNGFVFDVSMPDDRFVKNGGLDAEVIKSDFGNATASDVKNGKTFTSADGVKIEGTMPTMGEKTYTVSLDHPIVVVDKGYHDDTTAQIIREQEKTVTPSKDGTTVSPASGRVLSTVKVLGDANLVAGNIKKGVSIFGVTGTFEGGASIATCTVNIEWAVTARYALITATTFANGAISRFTSKTGSGTVTIPNVVCGSVITVYTGTATSVYGWSYGKDYSYDVYTHALTIPTSEGTYTAEIGVIDD